MRNRLWIAAFILIAACLLLALLRSSSRQRIVPFDSRESSDNQRGDQGLASDTAAPKSKQSPSASLPSQTVTHGVAQGNTPTNEIQERALATWRAPIDFFGKVLDENGTPVAGANVMFSWSENPTPDGEQRAETQSDPHGCFSIRRKHGPNLVVRVSKDGYYASRGGQRGFDYMAGEISPDPLKPVVFRLRIKGQGSELTTSENGMRPSLAIRIPKNDIPVRVDLLQKTTSAHGQLEIEQNKPPWPEATEWSFALRVFEGGLVENEDEFQFEAPETNYVPALEYRFTKGGSNWTSHVSKQFYISFGEPRQYGWLRIESDLAQETVFLTYAINPSGSRNLEPAH